MFIIYSSLVIFVDDIFIANSNRFMVKRLRPLFERSVIILRRKKYCRISLIRIEIDLGNLCCYTTHAPIYPRCDRCAGRVPSRDKGRISPSPKTISVSRVSISMAAKVSVSNSLKDRNANPCH